MQATNPELKQLLDLKPAQKSRVKAIAIALLEANSRYRPHLPSILFGICGAIGAYIGSWCVSKLIEANDLNACLLGSLAGMVVLGSIGGLLGLYLLNRALLLYWQVAMELYQIELKKLDEKRQAVIVKCP